MELNEVEKRDRLIRNRISERIQKCTDIKPEIVLIILDIINDELDMDKIKKEYFQKRLEILTKMVKKIINKEIPHNDYILKEYDMILHFLKG